jgi:hypothetical protein
MRCSDKSFVESQKTHVCPVAFFFNHAIYEIVCKMVEPDSLHARFYGAEITLASQFLRKHGILHR